ncbi:glycoside hydrolase family 30 protein [Mucilaginibacter segetis]|nr:glycoside hydrolase family 30 beta sandwich domain-containing protein [Mucilaginibacter segetis]
MPASAQNASLWLSTVNRKSEFELQKETIPFAENTTTGQQISIDDTKTFQTIDGFGFALTGGSAMLIKAMSPAARTALLKDVFASDGNNIGVSYLRLSIGASDLNQSVFTYDDMPDGETDPSLKKFSLSQDMNDVVPVLKEILAINKNIKILSSPWTAPCWMKTNNNIKGGQLKPEYYKVYADYFVKYIKAMQQQGITIDAITIQNEPLNDRNTPSMQMFAPEQATFIKTALGPALKAAGIKTKIVLFDHNCDTPEYPMSILADPEAAKYVDGSGFHLYAGTIDAMSEVHEVFPAKNLYFTEQMIIERNGTTIGMPVERLIIGATNNWSKNVLLWNLAADQNNDPHTNDGGCPICQGAITIQGDQFSKNIAYYTIAHASKFVVPGSVRVASTKSDKLPNVVFKTPDGKMVMIVVNVNGRRQNFSITYKGKYAATSLGSGDVGTYVW